LGDASLAEDVFQETFLQVHTHSDRFDTSRRFKPWLFTIAANRARDTLRRLSRRPAVSIDAAYQQKNGEKKVALLDLMESVEGEPSRHFEEKETREMVRKVLNEMPEHLRSILFLIYFHGFAYKEVAEMMNLPVGTVKSRMHSAVAKLSEGLKDKLQV
jgi:RNA polymerase sigma-70 factor (ECF subfamily)